MLGAAVACIVGAVDDFRGLDPLPKLAGQVAAAAIPCAFGVWIDHFTFPFVGVVDLPAWVGMPLTVIWIVAVMNMVNFLDGMDGLASGVCAIAGLTSPRSRSRSGRSTLPSSRPRSPARASGSSATTSSPRASSWATRVRWCSGSRSRRCRSRGC